MRTSFYSLDGALIDAKYGMKCRPIKDDWVILGGKSYRIVQCIHKWEKTFLSDGNRQGLTHVLNVICSTTE